jgi:nitrate reductase NapE component
MKQSVIMYGPSARGYDPGRQTQPIYYQPAYYPYPYYYQPGVNPYEAVRQGQSADRIASIIWKLLLLMVVIGVVGAVGFIAWVTTQ